MGLAKNFVPLRVLRGEKIVARHRLLRPHLRSKHLDEPLQVRIVRRDRRELFRVTERGREVALLLLDLGQQGKELPVVGMTPERVGERPQRVGSAAGRIQRHPVDIGVLRIIGRKRRRLLQFAERLATSGSRLRPALFESKTEV